MKYFDDDINWIFTFCKVCWDFKKIVFEKPFDFNTDQLQQGRCTKCNAIQTVAPSDARKYYEDLNKENN